MKNFILLIFTLSFGGVLFSQTASQNNYCWNEIYPLEDLYSHSGCGIGDGYDKVDEIRMTVEVPTNDGLREYNHFVPVVNTFDLSTLYSGLEVYLTTLEQVYGLTVANNQFLVYCYYFKTKNNGSYCIRGYNTFNYNTAITLKGTIPDFCPQGVVNFNDYIDPSSIIYGSSNLYGGSWSFSPSLPSSVNGGITNLGGANADIYNATYTKTLYNNCTVVKTFDPFEIFPSASTTWVQSITNDTLLVTDSPLNLSPYATANGGLISFSGPGVYLNPTSGYWELDPSVAGVGEFDVGAQVTTPNGCVFENSYTHKVVVKEVPLVLSYIPIDLHLAGFNNIGSLGYSYDYSTPTAEYVNQYTDTQKLMYIAQKGHSVCNGDTLNLKVKLPQTNYTYKWYRDKLGYVEFLEAGTSHVEVINYDSLGYNIFVSATSNSNQVEGPKDPFYLSVNQVPNYINDTIIYCFDSLSIFSPSLNLDNQFTPFYYGSYNSTYPYPHNSGILDSAAAAYMNGFDFYDENDNFISRDIIYNYNWDNSTKTKLIKFKQKIKSRGLYQVVFPFGTNWWQPYFAQNAVHLVVAPDGELSYQSYYPLTQSYGPKTYYDLTMCECEEKEFNYIYFDKNPEISFYSNLIGNVDIGTPVQFIDTSSFKGLDYAIDWNFNDGSYDYQGDTVWHYYNEYGYFTVDELIIDSLGCSKYSSTVSHIIVEDFTSINENDININVYPNPTLDIIYINYNETISYNLTTLSGQILLSGKEKDIDLNSFDSGVYILEITLNNGNTVKKKIIKQ